MKALSGFPVQHHANEPGDEGTHDAEDDRHDDAHVHGARIEETRQNADDQTHDDHADDAADTDISHWILPLAAVRAVLARRASCATFHAADRSFRPIMS